MKCEACGSETPPHYQQHSLAAIICHTCKSLGKFVQGLVVESKPPAIEESVQNVEQTVETGPVKEEPAKDDENTEPPVPAQDAKTDEAVPQSAQDTTPTTPPSTGKKKTTKL